MVGLRVGSGVRDILLAVGFYVGFFSPILLIMFIWKTLWGVTQPPVWFMLSIHPIFTIVYCIVGACIGLLSVDVIPMFMYRLRNGILGESENEGEGVPE